MKKIQKDDLGGESLLPVGNRAITDFPEVKKLIDIAHTLMIGDAVRVQKDEWTIKSDPRIAIMKVVKDKEFTLRTLKDRSGWVVIRIS